MMSSTQFGHRCLGSPPVPNVSPTKDERCWLCGGATGGAGWPRAQLPPTFTNINLAAVPTAGVLCAACAYFAQGATWNDYVAAHPDTGLKTGHAMSWRSYSHAFWSGHHECPTRARWRELLLAPPAHCR